MTITTRIEKAFGADLTANPASWVYTDVSAYALGSVTVTPGRPDEASTTTPTRCTFRLKNTDGRFSPRLPSSPYYPNVRRQTPVRISLNPGTGYVVRFQGYVDEIVPSWPSGNSDYAEVEVTASGSLRRLMQGNKPLRSALYRSITGVGLSGGGLAPRFYWSLEDGANATQAASAVPSVAPLTVSGALNFAATAGPAGSEQLPDFTQGGQLTGSLTDVSAVSGWHAQFIARIKLLPGGGLIVPLSWRTSDGLAWQVKIQDIGSGGLALLAGSTTVTTSFAIDDDAWHEVRVSASQAGPDVSVSVIVDGVNRASGTVTGLTLTRIIAVTVGHGSPTTFLDGLGHVSGWDVPVAVGALDSVQAMNGYVGETATARLTRLCAEQGVNISITGTSTTTMGPQGVDTFLNLLRECETADIGILYDGAGPGLSYLARAARYNQAVSLALDTKRQQVKLPFSPTEDDQRIRNDWTVSRPGGTFAHFQDPAHVAANGLYDTSDTRNVQFDSNLLNQAAWSTHLGTVDEMRVPGLSLQLIDRPELWAAWLATTIGERVTAANLPAQYPPGILDMIVEGYTETWDSSSWKVDLNTSPYRPWIVGALNTSLRLEMAGQTLAANLVAGATSLSLATAAGHQLFTTTAKYPADFPLDLNVAGWQIHVTAATGAASPQTLTISASPNMATIPAGTPVTLWRPAALAL